MKMEVVIFSTFMVETDLVASTYTFLSFYKISNLEI